MKHTFFLLSSFLLSSASRDSLSSKGGKFARVRYKDYFDDDLGARFPKETSQPLKHTTCFLSEYYNSLFKAQIPLQEIKFDASSECNSSLAKTFNPDNQLHDVAGSSIQLRNPSRFAHLKAILYMIVILCLIVFIFTKFIVVTAVTFLVNWITLNRYPKRFIFYNNLCWVILLLGRTLKCIPSTENEILAMKDVKQEEIKPTDVLYFPISCCSSAAVYWLVFLAYAWYCGFSGRGSEQKSIQRMKMAIQWVAWLLPFSVFEIKMESEGYLTVTRNCFVGLSNINIFRVASLLGVYCLTLSLINVAKVMFNSEEFADRESKQKFLCRMLNRGFIALCLVIHFCITFSYYNWDEGVKDYAACLAKSSVQPSLNGGESSYSECVLKSKPSLFVFFIHHMLSCKLETFISSLILDKSILERWKSFYDYKNHYPFHMIK